MQTVIIVIHLMVVMAMIVAVLLQKSEGGGLGMGGGSGFMTNRGSANVLTRMTSILAAVFFATSLLLSILASLDRRPTSIFGGASTGGGAVQQPANGAIPSAKDILNDLQKSDTPAQPAAPQVPNSR